MVLISILQIYNWFSKRVIQPALILYFSMQFLGYLTPIQYKEKCDWAAPGFWYFIFGPIMALLTCADYWAFYFHPLQKNVFLNQTKLASRASFQPSRRQSDTQSSMLDQELLYTGTPAEDYD